MPSIIKPFLATYYNSDRVGKLSSVVCPPYDVIGAKQLSSLRKKSLYNFSNIILASNESYKEIGERFRRWIKEDIFIKDYQDNLYLYEQQFVYNGKKYIRIGIFSLLRMDKRGIIYPHERTIQEAKEDRRMIIEEMKANLTPIFVVALKPLKIFAQIYRLYSRRKPFLQFVDFEGNSNLIWKIKRKSDIKRICRQIDKCKLLIADGHHRFEVAYDYYLKNKDKFKDPHYILAYITAPQKGLVILSTHRIVDVGEDNFLDRLRKYFYIRDTDKGYLKERLRNKRWLFSLGVYNRDKFYFLRLKKAEILDKIIGNAAYRHLDTYLLHKFIFPLLKIEGKISYTHSIEEAEKMAGSKRTAFILRASTVESVFKMVKRGLRLPEKSTYFYPKVVSGIVIRRFEPNRGCRKSNKRR